MPDSTPVVFISYSHDSDVHRESVLGLSERLRNDGIETRLDRYVNGAPSEGWPRWMLNQLEEASHVIVVCTETYYRRFRGKELPDMGWGADFEGALITQEIYEKRSKTVKFVPLVFAREDRKFIPEPLPRANLHVLDSSAHYQRLLDFLMGVGGVAPNPIGKVKKREPHVGKPLVFPGEIESTSTDQPTHTPEKFEAIPATTTSRKLEEAFEPKPSGLDASPARKPEPTEDLSAAQQDDGKSANGPEPKFGTPVAPPSASTSVGEGEPEVAIPESPLKGLGIQIVVVLLVGLFIAIVFLIWHIFGPSNQPKP